MPRSRTLILGVALALIPLRASADDGIAHFEKHIRPLLIERCYECHSATKAKGGLRLDSRDALRAGGDSGSPLDADQPDASLLLKAVRYTESELKMPPKGKLPAEAIAALEKWVKMGAPDPRTGTAVAKPGATNVEAGRTFWAFQPLKPETPPTVRDGAWPRDDIDRYILAKIEEKQLTPAADADRAVLIRRVSFDLIGLPPTSEEIDAFVTASRTEPQAAYEALVDQLLASPHFGERWGRHWLDLARFSESSGGGRTMLFKEAWRYRDYVIDALNRDVPYDRFLTEQIAGDLLPASTAEQKHRQTVATTFLAIGPTNYERQDKTVLEMDVIDEQLDTIGKAVLGLTIGCARCHDHKFDPIPTRDYYALAGILRSTKTLIHDNVSRWIERPLPMAPEVEAAVKAHDATVAELKERIRVAKAAEAKAGKAVALTPVKPSDLPGVVVDDAQAKKVGTWKPSKFSSAYVGDGYVYDDRSTKDEKTVTFVPDIPKAGMYEVRLAYTPSTNRATNVPVRIFHSDGDNAVTLDMRQPPPIDGRFVSLGAFRFDEGDQWFVMLSTAGTNGHVIADAVQFIPEGLMEKKEPKGTAKATDSRALEAELKKLQEKAPPRPMAMSVEEGAKIADCPVCIRGNVHNPGEVAPRGFLSVVGSAPKPGPTESGRRELAAWMTSKDNPLTARVAANRVWHHLFGVGLVRTVDNFGVAGERPSHPELLDHLSRHLSDGWSMKKLIRRVVLSRTYQLSSDAKSASDPENRLFSHANRRRLEAEAIRDAILCASGQLDRTIGGPNVKAGTTAERDYVFADVRRSVYTPVFRNKLHELFEVFDFADPNLVLGRRNVSTVPTQALYLMNSPFAMDQARHAAKRSQAWGDPAKRLDRAYREALGRPPTVGEREAALRFVASGEPAWERLFQALFGCIDFRYVR